MVKRLGVATFALALGASCGSRPSDSGTPGPTLEPSTASVLVSRVIDGDTIIVSAPSSARSLDDRPLDGERVRLVGIDTPEIARPGRAADCYGPEASELAKARLQGQPVELDFDTGTSLRDRFGRLLAYVRVEGLSDSFNANLVRLGMAAACFDHRLRASYRQLESEARASGQGLWSACASGPECS